MPPLSPAIALLPSIWWGRREERRNSLRDIVVHPLFYTARVDSGRSEPMVKQPGCQTRMPVPKRASEISLSLDQDRLSIGELDNIARRFHLCKTPWAENME
jgi:hypothetical protein